uniref:RING-type domain-containing protein n=1 Tax=Plectus sambesii TaxID=2011161 RepID=A0A914XD32_9BILA
MDPRARLSPYNRLLVRLQRDRHGFDSEVLNEILREIRSSLGGTFDGVTTELVYNQVLAHLSVADHAASSRAVKREPAAAASQGNEDEEGELCCVCQWPMRPGVEAVTRMKCNHEFHQECIREWLNANASCPLCKHHTLMPDEYPELG